MTRVTGRAQYTDDLSFADMLYGGTLYSPYASAKVVKIDTRRAKEVQGVKAVVTFADLPCMVSWGSYRYLTDIIRFQGDAVAVVAAETREALAEALAAIEVEYEELPAVFTIEDALAEGAHTVREDWPDNIHKPSCFKVRKGDVEDAFSKSDVVLEREYRTHYVEHAYMEPESAIAVPGTGATEMQVHACCVNPFFTRHWVADALGVPRSRVQVVQRLLGGSFGGKEELMGLVACRAALLAKKTGRARENDHDAGGIHHRQHQTPSHAPALQGGCEQGRQAAGRLVRDCGKPGRVQYAPVYEFPRVRTRGGRI